MPQSPIPEPLPQGVDDGAVRAVQADSSAPLQLVNVNTMAERMEQRFAALEMRWQDADEEVLIGTALTYDRVDDVHALLFVRADRSGSPPPGSPPCAALPRRRQRLDI